MAKKGKFSQPRDPKPQGDDLDLSFLDGLEDGDVLADSPIPDDLLADPLADLVLPEETVPAAPATPTVPPMAPAAEPAPAEPAPAAPAPMPVVTAPGLEDAVLPLDPDDDPEAAEDEADEQPSRGKNKKVILISLCSVALVALIGLVAAVTFLLGDKDDGRILNNVTVAGVNLGGIDRKSVV